MSYFTMGALRPTLRGAAASLLAALVLTSCTVPHQSSSLARSPVAPPATAFLNPSSICGTDQGDNVHQFFNGDFTGCFRVPNLASSSLVVALQTIVNTTSTSSGSPTTTSPPPTKNNLTLTLSSATATPGETIVVTGHLRQRLSVKQPLPTLCWDGCGALQEEGSGVHWTSSRTFQMNFQVPSTAWLVSSGGAVKVHPLTSGTYEVGVQCLTSVRGCALGPAEAQTPLHLNAPPPTRCYRAQRCETLSLSTTRARVGDEVLVKGWAPLQLIIGQPFGYGLSVTAGSLRPTFPSLTFAPTLQGGAINVVLTPRNLHVVPSPTWASLGRVHYVSSTFSGPSGLTAQSNSSLVAWCQQSRIVITGGGRRVHVPTQGVRAALADTPLKIFANSPGVPPCDAVQLDPRADKSVYAGFATAPGNSIPPSYLAALYTTNAGRTWHTVPTPSGTSITDFGGFTTRGDKVLTLFSTPNNLYSNRYFPLGTNHGVVSAEATTNGGITWTPTTLGCPTGGPCATFGPYPSSSNCNMGSDSQALLLGPPGATASSVTTWTSSTWVTTVDSCFSQQLVVSSPNDLFLLDPSSQYPLLASTTSGRTWTYRALPVIASANYGGSSIPLTNSLLLAPDGSLFATITTPSGASQELWRLAPFATSWCHVPHVFGSPAARTGLAGPLRVNASSLLWSQTRYPTNGAGPPTTSMHVVALSRLRC